MTLLSLAPELLFHIGSYLEIHDLANFEQVSQGCRKLALDTHLWNKIFTRYSYPQTTQMTAKIKGEFIDFLSKRTEVVFSAILSFQGQVTDQTIKRALQHCPPRFLRSAMIEVRSESSITGASLKAIISQNPNIQTIGLISSEPKAFLNISDRDLAEISWAKKLTAVAITGCPRVTESGLQALGHRARNLSEVWFQSDVISDALVRSIVTEHPALRTLKLVGRSSSVTDLSLKEIGKRGIFLDSLDIRIFVPTFSSNSVKKLLRNIPRVTELTLQGTKKMSNNIVREIPKRLPKIRSLYLGNCNKVTRKSIEHLSRCSELESLDLIGCKKPQKISRRLQDKQHCFFRLLHCNISL